MPFTLIKGTFYTKLGIPDGDSVRFKADNDVLYKKLKGKVQLKSQGTAQLRYEGIDAIEKAATQPLATEAKDANLKLLKGNTNIDTPRGYILSRQTEIHGRPVSFVFNGSTNLADGSQVTLHAALLKKSVNYKLVEAGYAYPLFYETLFAELRETFVAGVKIAQDNHRGYWPTDKTNTGVTVNKLTDLATIKPIFPKLWRRLEEYLKKNQGLSGFIAFLEAKNERLHTLSDNRFLGLQDVVEVKSGNKVRMKYKPTDIVFRPEE